MITRFSVLRPSLVELNHIALWRAWELLIVYYWIKSVCYNLFWFINFLTISFFWICCWLNISKYFGHVQAFKDNLNQFLAHMHNINSIFQLILEMLDFQESYNLITICSFLTITQNLELFPTRKLRREFKNYKSSLARIFSRKSKDNFSKKNKIK